MTDKLIKDLRGAATISTAWGGLMNGAANIIADQRSVNKRLKQRVKELEEENKMLMRSLAAQPDKQNSTGAAQAQMEYQIELRNKRIKELEDAINQFCQKKLSEDAMLIWQQGFMALEKNDGK